MRDRNHSAADLLYYQIITRLHYHMIYRVFVCAQAAPKKQPWRSTFMCIPAHDCVQAESKPPVHSFNRWF